MTSELNLWNTNVIEKLTVAEIVKNALISINQDNS
jgi:hypothetical protein